jgi:hypothetical protein
LALDFSGWGFRLFYAFHEVLPGFTAFAPGFGSLFAESRGAASRKKETVKLLNKGNPMKKFVHALVLVVFGLGCFFTWGILKLAPIPAHRTGHGLPGFTTFCVNLQPLLLVLPFLAAVYCLWVWFRKADKAPSWMGFFAATTAILVIVMPPAMIAAYLPLVDALNRLQGK